MYPVSRIDVKAYNYLEYLIPKVYSIVVKLPGNQ